MSGIQPEPASAGDDGRALLPRFSTAEDVNPPLPGDPGYEDYVARRAEWMRWVDHERAAGREVELGFTSYFDANLGPGGHARTPRAGSADARGAGRPG